MTETERVLPVIMAGGEGTRLRPLTETVPKPMLPIDGIPALVRLLGLLKKEGFSRAVITVRYLADKITVLGNEWEGMRLFYLRETDDLPLGTAGSVRAAAEIFAKDETDLLILSGDAVTDADPGAFYRFHREKSADASLLSVRVRDPSSYGLILSDRAGRITGFTEKPSEGEAVTDDVNTGIYLLGRAWFETLPRELIDFGSQVFPHALAAGARLFAYRTDCYWCDIGSPEAFRNCSLAVSAGKIPSFSPSSPLPKRLSGNVIGQNCFIPENAVVSGSVLFDRVKLGEGARVLDSVLCAGVRIGKNAMLSGALLGENASVGDGVRLPAGTVLSAGETAAEETQSLSMRGEEGYFLSASPSAPDIAFCIRLGEALGRYAAETGCTLLFCRTENTELLSACEGFVSDTARCYAEKPCFRITGVCAVDALRDPGVSVMPELAGEKRLLRVIFHRIGGIPAVRLADTDGGYPGRACERALDRVLSVPAEKPGAMCAVKEIPAARLTAVYRSGVLSHADIYAPGTLSYRIDRAGARETDVSLLVSLLSASFGDEDPASSLSLSLAPDAERGDVFPVMRYGKRTLDRWMLLVCALWAETDRAGRTVFLPASAPVWIDGMLGRLGYRVRRFSHAGREAGDRDFFRAAEDGIRLLFLVCAACAERGLSPTELWNLASGKSPARVRESRDSGVSASPSLLRRLSEEADFRPAAEGLIAGFPDGSTVRVTGTRTNILRIMADAFSSEQAEELCVKTDILLRALEREKTKEF